MHDTCAGRGDLADFMESDGKSSVSYDLGNKRRVIFNLLSTSFVSRREDHRPQVSTRCLLIVMLLFLGAAAASTAPQPEPDQDLGDLDAVADLNVSRESVMNHHREISTSARPQAGAEPSSHAAPPASDRPRDAPSVAQERPQPGALASLSPRASLAGTTSTQPPPIERVSIQDDQTSTIVVNSSVESSPLESGQPARTSKAPRTKFQCNQTTDCHNGALCHRGTCFCLPGFTGATCELDIDECRQFGDGQQPACLNGGLCVDEINAFACKCAPGFQGERCQEPVDMCANEPCANGAACENHRTSYTCKCAAGWEGSTCERNTDDCAPENPCQNQGRCRDLLADFKCDCPAGFTGKRCEQNVDECAAKPCAANSSLACVDLINDYRCQCAPGFSGKQCQVDIDECIHAPCLNQAKCLDLIHGYKCLCAPAWTGDHCERDVDECEQAAASKTPLCLNGGRCENLSPSYKCHCREGWAGKNCSEVSDYCKAKKPCSKHGQCVNLITTKEGKAQRPGESPFRCDCLSSHIGAACETRRNCTNECHPERGICVANGTICACSQDVEWHKSLEAQLRDHHTNRSTKIDQKGEGAEETRDAGKRARSMCEFVSRCEQIGGDGAELCSNKGTCTNLETGGYRCLCAEGYEGPNCQHTSDRSKVDLLALLAIVCAGSLLAACALGALLMFRRVRKARATRGTYSPSTQENFESNLASVSLAGDLLKPPIPERLI